MFTDESRFQLSHSDGRKRVHRRRYERYADCWTFFIVIDTVGESLMVWGGIISQHRTILINADGNLTGEKYRDEIIELIEIPFLRQHGPGITLFQLDNARPHTTRVVHYVLNQNNVNALPWLANSPDLSPIEHVLDEMGRRLRRLPQPTDLRQLAGALIQVWTERSLKTFIHMSLAQWGEDAQLWSMHVGDTHSTDFVTSISLGTFSAKKTSANMKMAFCKFRVRLTISEMSWTLITSLFQWVFCHGWKNITNFTMHSFFCCKICKIN